AAEIDVVQHEPQQRRGQRQHDECAQMRSHEGQKRLYYTALARRLAADATCCCCQHRASLVRCVASLPRKCCCRSPPPFSARCLPNAPRIDKAKFATSTIWAINC